jgi:hypothetical protein
VCTHQNTICCRPSATEGSRLPKAYFVRHCSLGLSATSQQYFSLTINQPPATSQQYSSLRTNQHQPSATSQPNRLVVGFFYISSIF